MSTGDTVIMSPGTQGPHATYAPDGPLFGVIVAESENGSTTANVLWENGKKTDDLERDIVLRKIQFSEGEDDPQLANFLGKFVQVAGFPEVLTPDSRPKSPAAAGVVHRAFVVFPDFSGESDPEFAFVVMSWYDGRIRVCVPAPSLLLDPPVSALRDILVAQPGRRLVGFG